MLAAGRRRRGRAATQDHAGCGRVTVGRRRAELPGLRPGRLGRTELRDVRAARRARTEAAGVLPRRDLRQRHGLHDPLDDVVGRHAVGERVVGEHQPVPQHVGGDVEDVLRQHVVAAADQGERAGGGDEAERGAGAGAVGHPGGDVLHAVLPRRAGGHDEPDDVVDQRVVHEDLRGGLLQPAEVVGAEDGLGHGRLGAHPVDDLPLLLGARVVDEHLHQEPVALGLGQRVDALGLDRVLGGEDEEGVGQRVGDPADGDLPLGHDLEQRRLHLGGRAVDLVGEHEVGEHRAELDVEGVLAGLVDAGADDVGGHQVGGELQAGELAADGGRQRLDREGLRDAGHALEQHVPAGQQGDEHPLDQAVLADDDALDLEQHPLQLGGVDRRRDRRGGTRALDRGAGSAGHGAPWSCRSTAPGAVDGAVIPPRSQCPTRS